MKKFVLKIGNFCCCLYGRGNSCCKGTRMRDI